MTGFFKKDRPRRKLRKLIKEKKLDEALEFGHSIEKKYENDPDIDFIIGTIYFLKGDSKKTLSYMDKVLDIAEYDIDALALKATILLHLKNKEEVMLCCDKIRIIDPKNQTVKEILYKLKEI